MPAPRHLYVHVPFCTRRCSYCDFAIAVRKTVPVADYLEGVERELALRAPVDHWSLDTLYFGGGTPSRLGPSGVSDLTKLIRRFATLNPGAEVTLEANPEDIDERAAESWLEAGVTRLSIGIQSFDDAVLAWMHRVHDGERGREAFRAARRAGFREIGVDLIYSIPEALNRDWGRDLETAITLGPEHVSLYGLAIEARAPLARRKDRGEVVEGPEDAYAAEFMQAHALLCNSKYRHYEVSNFALDNRIGRHNSSYWRGVPYDAIGPSAHSFDGAARRWNRREYSAWLGDLRAGVDPTEGREKLGFEERETERIYLGLRTDSGLEISPDWRPIIDSWVAEGWASVDADRVLLTAEGWLRLDSLAAALTGTPTRVQV